LAEIAKNINIEKTCLFMEIDMIKDGLCFHYFVIKIVYPKGIFYSLKLSSEGAASGVWWSHQLAADVWLLSLCGDLALSWDQLPLGSG